MSAKRHTGRIMVSQNLRTHELFVILTTKEVALNSLRVQKDYRNTQIILQVSDRFSRHQEVISVFKSDGT